jgi:hypothetical protein
MAFMACLKIHEERTELYGDLWQQYGAIHNFSQAARKAVRTKKAFDRSVPPMDDEALDDPRDSVNYLLFGIRCAIAGNFFEKEEEEE